MKNDNKTQNYVFDAYNLELSRADASDELIVRGKIERDNAHADSPVTLVEHHVFSSMDTVLQVDADGVFEAKLRKDEDYILHFVTQDETHSIALN